MLNLINNTLKDIIQTGEFKINTFMTRLISTMHYNGGVFFEANDDKYECTYVSGKKFQELFTVGQLLPVEELPEQRTDMYLRDAPIGAISCEPFESDVLEQVTYVVTLSISMIRKHRRNRVLLLKNLEICQDSMEYIAKSFIVNKQFIPVSKNDVIMSEMSIRIGKVLQSIREMRAYHTPTRVMTFSEVNLDALLRESLDITGHKTALIQPHVHQALYLDSITLKRSILIPVLQQYLHVVEVHVDTHDVNIVDGFLVITIVGATPETLKNIDTGDNLGLHLVYDTCFKSGGYLRVIDNSKIEISIPYKTTMYNLNNIRVLIDIANSSDQSLVSRLCTSLGSQIILDLNDSPNLVICDKHSKLLDIVNQTQVKTILYENERKLVDQLFKQKM